jgi:glycosyltransferase involved in cell wall biosynthesis
VRREFLLYVGSRAPYKKFDGMLKAFHETRLHDLFDLLMLGGGPLMQEEMDLMAQLSVTDSIISIPIATDALLAEDYAAKLLVYPSLWEGFGLPPLEAMAAGCPVLAS